MDVSQDNRKNNIPLVKYEALQVSLSLVNRRGRTRVAQWGGGGTNLQKHGLTA